MVGTRRAFLKGVAAVAGASALPAAAAPVAQVLAPPAFASAPPVGSIMNWSGMSVPKGWLLCDGSAHFIDRYPDLFNMIGASYGGDEALGLFSLPDLPQHITGFSGAVSLSLIRAA